MDKTQLFQCFGGNNTTGPIETATACNAKGGAGRMDFESETFVTHALRADGFDASEDGTGRGTPLVAVAFDTTQITSAANYSNPKPGDPCHPLASTAHPPAIAFRAAGQDGFTPARVAPPLCATDGGGTVPTVAFSCKDHGADAGEIAPTLRSMGHDGSHANAGGQVAVAFQCQGTNVSAEDELTGTVRSGNQHVTGGSPCVGVALRGREGGATAEIGDEVGNALRGASGGGDKAHVLTQMAVRRLTPRECERLQGFPDDWTAINFRGKPAADGPRYKAIGNSMAVPVMRWILQRIQFVHALSRDLQS